MTQERQDPTVIHGLQPESYSARCGEEKPETVTVNLATMTCQKCINVARERMCSAIKHHRTALALLGDHLAQLDPPDKPHFAIIAALAELDIELDRLRIQLKLDAITQEVEEEASDA